MVISSVFELKIRKAQKKKKKSDGKYKTLLIDIIQESIVFLQKFTSRIPFLRSRGAISRVSRVCQSFFSRAGFEIACEIARIAHKIGKSRIIKNSVQYFTSLHFFHRRVILLWIFFNVRRNQRFFISFEKFCRINSWIGRGKQSQISLNGRGKISWISLTISETSSDFLQSVSEKIANFNNRSLKKKKPKFAHRSRRKSTK